MLKFQTREFFYQNDKRSRIIHDTQGLMYTPVTFNLSLHDQVKEIAIVSINNFHLNFAVKNELVKVMLEV